MSVHISGKRDGFGKGYTPVTSYDERQNNAGIGFGILKLAAGETRDAKPAVETAWLLMDGAVSFAINDDAPVSFSRKSLFDENPACIHVPAGTAVTITAQSDAELSMHSVNNTRSFPVTVYGPKDVKGDVFGKGEVGGACERLVRTIFDCPHENSELVLGEVINPPGKWSSYPPHSHPEAEIYHYRFDKPQGFGFGQDGESGAIQIRHGDTYKIINGVVHSQAAAPGYAMWYSWTIHNPPGHDWTRNFHPDHEWTRDPKAKIWKPGKAA